MLKLLPLPTVHPERVRFRCWKCRHRFGVTRARVGETLQCDCGEDVRVPRWDHGNCRVRGLFARFLEAALCGGGFALVALLTAVMLVPRLTHAAVPPFELAVWTIASSLVGVLVGGPAIEVIGTVIRARQHD
jgi:hypothetical protein